MANEKTWQFTTNLAMDNTSTTTNWKNMVWAIQAFLRGLVGGTNYKDTAAATLASLQGLWTVYYSCDGTTAGTAGDGIGRWNTAGSNTANSGSAASITTGASITGAVRLTGLTGMASSSVGKMMTISGAASAGNNSKTNTPWVICNFVSATSVDIFNPSAVTGDANNGSITWQEAEAPTYNASALVGASAGTAHSWMVLKSPTLGGVAPWYLTIDMRSSGIGNISFMLSKNAPTGGSTTARPTATDEIQTASWIDASVYSSGQGRFHAGLTTVGDWYFTTNGDGNGIRSQGFLQALQEAKSVDLYPVVMCFTGGATQTTSNVILGSSAIAMRNWNNNVTLNPYVALWTTNSGSFSVMATMTTTDATDGAYDDLPCYVYATLAGHKSLRGRLADLRWCPSGLADGTVEPAAGTPASVAFGDLWFPISVTPTL